LALANLSSFDQVVVLIFFKRTQSVIIQLGNRVVICLLLLLAIGYVRLHLVIVDSVHQA
jgi:hypothetical protein